MKSFPNFHDHIMNDSKIVLATFVHFILGISIACENVRLFPPYTVVTRYIIHHEMCVGTCTTKKGAREEVASK